MTAQAELIVHLDHRDLLDINNGEGLAVTCVAGTVWITQSADARDIIIGEGQTFILDKPGLALVVAPVGRATIMVNRAGPETASISVDLPTAGDLRFAA
jgi:hypothetical protein